MLWTCCLLVIFYSFDYYKMPSCAFLKCKNNTRNKNKNLGITFHTFPRDFGIRKSWVDIIRMSRRDEEWEANQFSRICSIHFDESDMYITSKGFRKIKKTATPLFQDSQKTAQIFLPLSSPNSSISISSSVLNTAQNTEYLKKIDRLTHENKICKSKVKSLRQKYSLLQKKYTMLESSMQNFLRKAISPDESQNLAVNQNQMNDEKPHCKPIEPDNDMKRPSIRRGILKKKKYLPSLKKFASTINFYSPAAYKYVRRVFALALLRPRAFKYWLDRVRQKPDLLAKHFMVNRSSLI